MHLYRTWGGDSLDTVLTRAPCPRFSVPILVSGLRVWSPQSAPSRELFEIGFDSQTGQRGWWSVYGCSELLN